MGRPKNNDTLEMDEFEGIQLNKELAVNRDTGKKHQEAPSEKLVRKFKENPFLPIGCGATTFFLVNGLFKFGRKDSEGSQKMMRGRIVAQGFTVMALLTGIMVSMRKNTWVAPTSDPNGQLLKDHLDKQAKSVSEVKIRPDLLTTQKRLNHNMEISIQNIIKCIIHRSRVKSTTSIRQD